MCIPTEQTSASQQWYKDYTTCVHTGTLELSATAHVADNYSSPGMLLRALVALLCTAHLLEHRVAV